MTGRTDPMTPQELADELARMYCNACKNYQVAMIHLFGITYANQLRDSEESIRSIVQRSGIRDSYVTEVNKGIRLAEFVVLKS